MQRPEKWRPVVAAIALSAEPCDDRINSAAMSGNSGMLGGKGDRSPYGCAVASAKMATEQ
eukprot:12203010-Alexandrium_andersonii.AAC.1